MKRSVNGSRDLCGLLLVRLGESVKDDKEGEEKRDEVGIGNQPAVISNTGAMHATIHASCSIGGFSELLRNPDNLTSSMRGFIPSRIEMTPSNIISRRK